MFSSLFAAGKEIPILSLHHAEVAERITFSSSYTESMDEILSHVKKNDACVYWYMGPNYFKQGAVDFYKSALSKNLKVGATPFLVDLTAWGAFKKKCSITSYHESSVSLDCAQIKTLLCSNIFESLQKLTPEESVFSLLQEILRREELLVPSAHFDYSNITLGEIFKDNCPVISEHYKLDCAKAYSVIQYVEFLFMLESILLKKPGTKSIKFILPNDEAKYYLPTMAKDAERFLDKRGHKTCELDIQVHCFKYGEELFHRPYNSLSKNIPGKKKLLPSCVIDEDILAELHGASASFGIP